MQKLTLQQRLLQKLSPQQIQVIKLLELPMLQLEQRIKKELEENPMLEMEEGSYESASEDDYSDDFKSNEDHDNEEFSVEDYLSDEDYASYKLETNNYSRDDKIAEMPYSEGASMYEFLQEQIRMVLTSEDEMILAEQIIGNIDEDGYLQREVGAIIDDIAFNRNIKTNEMEITRILHLIQELDPPGIGARNLRECLRIQIARKESKRPELELAGKILRDTFEEYTKKHYDKIQRKFNIDEKTLKDAIDEISRLNPKPGSAFSSSMKADNQTIIPDFILELVDDELVLSLNQKNVPELNISRDYNNLLRNYRDNNTAMSKSDRETIIFVKQKIDSAKWFIDAIKQRQETLMHVMRTILHFQREFFIEGDETKLRPMILKDIAERTKLDISTISRVSNSKYIQTHFGIYSLKYFFSESMQKEDGEEVSTREIKSILKDFIELEDKRKPLNDDELVNVLKEKGYNIARRTIAKYREQLDIPVARMRKEL